jgi:hypothetical protein
VEDVDAAFFEREADRLTPILQRLVAAQTLTVVDNGLGA